MQKVKIHMMLCYWREIQVTFFPSFLHFPRYWAYINSLGYTFPDFFPFIFDTCMKLNCSSMARSWFKFFICITCIKSCVHRCLHICRFFRNFILWTCFHFKTYKFLSAWLKIMYHSIVSSSPIIVCFWSHRISAFYAVPWIICGMSGAPKWIYSVCYKRETRILLLFILCQWPDG